MHVINSGNNVCLWNTFGPGTYAIHNRAMLIFGLFISQSRLKVEDINHMGLGMIYTLKILTWSWPLSLT